MQQLRHPVPAVRRAGGQGAGGRVAAESPTPQNTALSWSFPGSALDVTLSRRWLAAAVEQAWGAGEDTDRVVLAYSEVATNAVVHGRGPVTVSARIRAGTVTCDVADCSVHTPRPRHAAREDVCGRGLDLVAMTVDRFRVEVGEAGKTVSFEVGRHLLDRAGSGRSPVSRSGAGPVQTAVGGEIGGEAAPKREAVSALENAPGAGSESGAGRGPGSAGGSAGGFTGGGHPGAPSSAPGALPAAAGGGTA